MDQNEISARGWLAVVGATIAGMAVGGMLLGPPGAIAMSVIFGRGAYSHYRDQGDPR
jgi:hypothetical protein